MFRRYSHLLYWPVRMALELAIVFMTLVAITHIERARAVAFHGHSDDLRMHLLYALPVFWLARWRPWTIWITAPLWVLAMLALFVLAGAFYRPIPLYLPAFGLIVLAAYLLGKDQHRKPAQ